MSRDAILGGGGAYCHSIAASSDGKLLGLVDR